MASLVVFAVLAFLVAIAVLHFMGMRTIACWLLVILPVVLCAQGLLDISHGVANLGEAAFRGDQKNLTFSFGLLALSLLAAFRLRSPWLFWIAWTFNIAVCGILIYLIFFWKVFS